MATTAAGRIVLIAAMAAYTSSAAADEPAFGPATCEGAYPGHLQGVCTNDRDALYWSFTKALVKTDPQGRVLQRVEVPSHHGDLCHDRGRVYVAVNLGQFNNPDGHADNWIYVYDADTLELLSKHAVPEVKHGAGGMESRNGRFFVVGGLPPGVEENYVYEYDGDLQFVARHAIPSGNTLMGIQSAALVDGRWCFGCYGRPPELLLTEGDFSDPRRFDFDCAYGVADLGGGRALVASSERNKAGQWTGAVRVAKLDDERGFVIVAE